PYLTARFLLLMIMNPYLLILFPLFPSQFAFLQFLQALEHIFHRLQKKNTYSLSPEELRKLLQCQDFAICRVVTVKVRNAIAALLPVIDQDWHFVQIVLLIY